MPHVEGASAALEQLGFTLTPFSPQSHRLEPGGPLVPAGTANRCVMLERGYLEFVTPGLILFGVAGLMQMVSIAISQDMVEGIVARFRTMSISRGRLMCSLLMNQS